MKRATAIQSVEVSAIGENKTRNNSQSYATLKSIALKMMALLAFIAINFIGYRAFSEELPVATSTAQDAQSAVASAATQVAGPNEAQKIPSCEIAPEGLVANKWKNIRIQVGDAIVAGAETLTDLSHQLKQLVVEQKCLPIPVPCSFAAEGWALGSWVKHRIVIKDRIAFGGNTTARLFEEAGELKKIGVCE